jgi:broad specificity phosphatase PhoE
MKLYLVRHGRSAGNLPGRMTGWSDHSLTALGAAQAERVAERLAALGPMPVYASDLPRALETAAFIAARWSGEAGASAGAEARVRVHPDPRLREIDLGDYEGRSWDDFTADHELAAAFAREPLTTRLPGGESLALVRERVIAAFDEIVAGERQAACLVSHDGPIRTILNHVLRVPQERHWAISTGHGGLSLLETGDGWISVRFVNDTSHLLDLEVAAAPGDDGEAAGDETDAGRGDAADLASGDDGEAPARALEGL